MKFGKAFILLEYVADYDNNFITKENNLMKLGSILLNYQKIDKKIELLENIVRGKIYE